MKIRKGFVSNSSTTSFMLVLDKLPTADELKEIIPEEGELTKVHLLALNNKLIHLNNIQEINKYKERLEQLILGQLASLRCDIDYNVEIFEQAANHFVTTLQTALNTSEMLSIIEVDDGDTKWDVINIYKLMDRLIEAGYIKYYIGIYH